MTTTPFERGRLLLLACVWDEAKFVPLHLTEPLYFYIKVISGISKEQKHLEVYPHLEGKKNTNFSCFVVHFEGHDTSMYLGAQLQRTV